MNPPFDDAVPPMEPKLIDKQNRSAIGLILSLQTRRDELEIQETMRAIRQAKPGDVIHIPRGMTWQEVIAVASAAKWTAERPADPGYYWMRDKSDWLEEWLVLWAPNPSQPEFGEWVGVGFSGRHYASENHEFWSARIESPSTKP